MIHWFAQTNSRDAPTQSQTVCIQMPKDTFFKTDPIGKKQPKKIPYCIHAEEPQIHRIEKGLLYYGGCPKALVAVKQWDGMYDYKDVSSYLRNAGLNTKQASQRH
eukprot:PhF_6_TR32574/c0_g1_i1/m.48205